MTSQSSASLFWWEKHCTCTGEACQFACTPTSCFSTATHEPSHQFHIPNFKPVTLSPRYFSVPSYRSLKFIKITHKWQEYKWYMTWIGCSWWLYKNKITNNEHGMVWSVNKCPSMRWHITKIKWLTIFNWWYYMSKHNRQAAMAY